MGINLKDLQPHKVSRDLSGYITYIYGPGGAGKTTFGSQMPKPLIIAFEKGYNALPGVYAQDVTTWGEMKQVLRQLDDPDVKGMFSSVVIDTVDIASQLCQKYLCSQLGIESIGDGGWGVNGWAKVKKEWENTFNLEKLRQKWKTRVIQYQFQLQLLQLLQQVSIHLNIVHLYRGLPHVSFYKKHFLILSLFE